MKKGPSIVVPILLALLSCGEPAPDLNGHLYFASGNYLGAVNLRNGRNTVVANLGQEFIHQVSAYRDGELLLSTVAQVEGREDERVTFIRTDTMETAALYSGRTARYLPDAEVVVYDDGFNLQAVSLNEDVEIDPVVASYRQNRLTSIVPLSGAEILYEIRGNQGFQIYRADILNGETVELGALSAQCRLRFAIWLQDTRQLACKNPASASYVLTDLNAEQIRPIGLPEGKTFNALVFLHDQDALLFTEDRDNRFGSQQKSAVWAHFLSEGSTHRVMSDQYLGETAVYRRD